MLYAMYAYYVTCSRTSVLFTGIINTALALISARAEGSHFCALYRSSVCVCLHPFRFRLHQFQLVCQWFQDLYDCKWSLALYCELFVILEELEVLCFQPDLLTFLEQGKAPCNAFSLALLHKFMCCHYLKACLLEIV